MKDYADYPVGVIVSAVATFWGRLVGFMLAIIIGTVAASAIRPSGASDLGLLDGLMPLIYAPVAWLFSWVYAAANLATMIAFVILIKAESGIWVVAALAVGMAIWFVHGLLLWP